MSPFLLILGFYELLRFVIMGVCLVSFFGVCGWIESFYGGLGCVSFLGAMFLGIVYLLVLGVWYMLRLWVWARLIVFGVSSRCWVGVCSFCLDSVLI